MCFCILVTPKTEFGGSAAAIGFTSNTRDMTLPGHVGITFKSAPGITPTTIEMMLDEPTNLELTGIYQSGSFQPTDVLDGKWSFASIEIFSVCWDNVNLGEFLVFKGNLGDFKERQTHFVAEARGMLARMSNDVNKVTSRFCRVKHFRDAECGHTVSTVTIATVAYPILFSTSVTAKSPPYGLTFDSGFSGQTFPANYFSNGKLRFTSGLNSGISREIAYSAGPEGLTIKTKRPFPFNISMGDNAELTAGCNRTQADCMKFQNIVNRRAEDFIPGVESVSKITVVN